MKYMIQKVREYTEKTDFPILKEVCLLNDWDYDYFIQLQRENEILRVETKKLLAKKEIQLEKALMTGVNNTAFIFQLKQLGWKDHPDPLIVNNTIQNNVGGNRTDKLKKVSTETLEELESIYEEIEKAEDSE
jgi:hypothetical protein